MRVCIVVPYDLVEQGGVKRHAFQLATELRRLGDEVTIMGAASGGQHGREVHVFGGIVDIPSNGSSNKLSILTPPWHVRRWLHEREFDVIHVHEPMCPLLGPWASVFGSRAARVATFHAYAETEALVPRLMRWAVGPLVLPGFERAIAVSRPAAAYARFVWKRDLAIIPNGIPTETFVAAPPVERAAGEPVRILFVGHWRDARKGLPVLLDAFARLHARGLPVALDVVGQGPAGSAPPVLPGVRFHGPAAAEEAIAAHMRASDVFVAPATGQESFGIVLLEAMASARPIVCSDIAGYREVVTPDAARLVAPGSAAALEAALAELVAAPLARRAMGAAGRDHVERFAWTRVARRVRDEYEAAIAERSGRLRAAA